MIVSLEKKRKRKRELRRQRRKGKGEEGFYQLEESFNGSHWAQIPSKRQPERGRICWHTPHVENMVASECIL